MPFGRWREARSPFDSRTEVWREVGLGGEVDRRQAKRARGELVIWGALIAGVLIFFGNRAHLMPGGGTPLRVATVVLLIILGWGLARALGRGIAPALFARMDPGTAGTVGFLIRLITLGLMVVVALRIAGLNAETLAVGGAFTAIVLGLAAQQTIANLFAGLVLLSTRPFRVGERVRLVGGALAGEQEGIVGSLGLFYTTLVSGADRIMVPNNVVLTLAVIPLREPERVELRARFDAETTPRQVEQRIEDRVSVPLRYSPNVSLEELDHDDVALKIEATPADPGDGAKLADEIISAVREGRDGRREREPARS